MAEKIKVYIPGIKGMVGEAVAKLLQKERKYLVIGTAKEDIDLLNYESVFNFLQKTQPEIIVLAAARVGGGHAISKEPVEYLEENILIQINLMRAAKENGINNVIFVASSALYPANILTPISENDLFKGRLDSVQEPYGLAKLVGLHQTQYYNKQYGSKFITAIINNVIGNRDNGQVVFSLIKQMKNAKLNNSPSVTLWGSGEQRREFIFVEDVAHAIKVLIDNIESVDETIYNIGVQSDVSIKELSKIIKDIVQYKGELIFDDSKPEGVKRRILDSSRIFALGFKPETNLEEGIKKVYDQQL